MHPTPVAGLPERTTRSHSLPQCTRAGDYTQPPIQTLSVQYHLQVSNLEMCSRSHVRLLTRPVEGGACLDRFVWPPDRRGRRQQSALLAGIWIVSSVSLTPKYHARTGKQQKTKRPLKAFSVFLNDFEGSLGVRLGGGSLGLQVDFPRHGFPGPPRASRWTSMGLESRPPVYFGPTA